jgi:hypothetical protein
MPYNYDNLFSSIFDEFTTAQYGDNESAAYDRTFMVNEEVKDTPMPILERYDTETVRKIRSYAKRLRFANNWHKPIFTGKTLGIHYRGTDKCTDYELMPPENLVELVPMGYDSVFLSTDDEEAFNVLTRAYPNIVYHTHGRARTGDLGMHHRKLAEHFSESMIDLVSLTRCDHIFMGRSCYAEAALLFSRTDATWSYYV